MATLSQTASARPMKTFAGPRGLVDRYFYFAMSLLFPVIVISGFSRTINENLFHPAIPRPRMLWVHGAAFFSWVAFFLFPSVLVRTRYVKWHRFFGWFGAALEAAMFPLGIATAIVIRRFNALQLNRTGEESFFNIPVFDMAAFGTLLGLAIAWRKKPELGLGVMRDLLVNRRIHRAYLIALPVLIVLQGLSTLIWRTEAAWWVRIAHSVLA